MNEECSIGCEIAQSEKAIRKKKDKSPPGELSIVELVNTPKPKNNPFLFLSNYSSSVLKQLKWFT